MKTYFRAEKIGLYVAEGCRRAPGHLFKCFSTMKKFIEKVAKWYITSAATIYNH